MDSKRLESALKELTGLSDVSGLMKKANLKKVELLLSGLRKAKQEGRVSPPKVNHD